MSERFNLNKTYQYLLIILAFLMPISVSGANIIIVIICLMWLFSGSYKSKFNEIVSSKLMIASLTFYLLHVLGMFWTEDIVWGFHILHKMWYFLLLWPVLYSIVNKSYIKFYIYSFLIAIGITEICSYLIWFEIIEPFKHATIVNPTPFMSHISYNPILALAIYLVIHELLFNKKISNYLFSFYAFFAISMTFNMFITGGRAGQLVFFVIVASLIYQFFDKQRLKSLVIISIFIPSIFFSAYQASDLFRARVILAVTEIMDFNHSNNQSIGLRVNFALNSLDIVRENPIIGVGTGDFPDEYRRINLINTPELKITENPHSMYTLILVQLGVVGLVSMLIIFYFQIRFSLNSPNKFIRDTGVILPVMFLVLMFSDSYLLGHYTSLVFVFFSSFLHKDFEKS